MEVDDMKLSIQKQLEANNMSKYKLAQVTGMSYQAIQSIAKGENTQIQLQTVDSLCEALHCTPNDIIISDDN
jgi:DNA-binding Xre family transcriptional regulator